MPLRPRALLGTALLVGAALLGCGEPDVAHHARQATGGEPARGRQAILRHGCRTCHHIPGVPGARGSVGPSLAHVAGRMVLAGDLPNTPENLIAWIRHPQRLEPGTVMPEMGIGEQEGRDIAAYLYTLR
ncbi:MAG TPA: c-type cytochrome [Thermoanaerobaculia bacterium]|nr:c-type cytochrome [Thermoanaerobaculia bacterium]